MSEVFQIFKNHDLFHIYLAGQVAMHMAMQGTHHYNPKYVKELFHPIAVQRNIDDRKILEDLEKRTIKDLVARGTPLLNTTHNTKERKTKKGKLQSTTEA